MIYEKMFQEKTRLPRRGVSIEEEYVHNWIDDLNWYNKIVNKIYNALVRYASEDTVNTNIIYSMV